MTTRTFGDPMSGLIPKSRVLAGIVICVVKGEVEIGLIALPLGPMLPWVEGCGGVKIPMEAYQVRHSACIQ